MIVILVDGPIAGMSIMLGEEIGMESMRSDYFDSSETELNLVIVINIVIQ